MRMALLSALAVAGCVAPPIPPAPAVVAAVRPVPEAAGYAGPIRNPMVRDIQRQLRRHGYYPGPTDGINSPMTAAAIGGFQMSHGLVQDGVPSPSLLFVLRNTPPGR